MKTRLFASQVVRCKTLDGNKIMPHYLITLLFVAVLAASAFAQEDETDATESPVSPAPPALPESSNPDTTAENADEEDAEAEEDVDDADLDEQTYQKDDDDFVPSEEVPADEPIPFPTNI